MKNNSIVWFSLLFFVSACIATEKPPIPPDKMAQLLAEIHISESYREIRQMPPDVSLVEGKKEYNRILQNHQVSSADFHRSFDYYSKHPEELKEVYQKAIEIISEESAKFVP
ncbi:MAG: DUF4296 domain-containing protein [Bacteroidia bacterium]|nr:DUF4296 domain-containing protein [Bacteroidia bacterium]